MTLKQLSMALLVVLPALFPRGGSAQVTLSSGIVFMDSFLSNHSETPTALIGVRAELPLSFLDAYTGAFWRSRAVSCIGISTCPPGHGPHVVAGIGRQGGAEGTARPYAMIGLGWTLWRGPDHEGAVLVEAEGGARLPLHGRTGIVLGVRAERRHQHEATLFGGFAGVSVRLGGL